MAHQHASQVRPFASISYNLIYLGSNLLLDLRRYLFAIYNLHSLSEL